MLRIATDRSYPRPMNYSSLQKDLSWNSWAHSEPCQTPQKERCVKIVNGWKPFFAKHFILGIRQAYKYPYAKSLQLLQLVTFSNI